MQSGKTSKLTLVTSSSGIKEEKRAVPTDSQVAENSGSDRSQDSETERSVSVESETDDEEVEEPFQTPLPVRTRKLKKQKLDGSVDRVNTPSTATTMQSDTDNYLDIEIPTLDDSTIPLSYSGRHRKATPPITDGQSGNESSTPSTPSKPPSKRRRVVSSRGPVPTHAEAVKKVENLTAELKSIIEQHRAQNELYEDLTYENSATPDILDASVRASRHRLQQALHEYKVANCIQRLPASSELPHEIIELRDSHHLAIWEKEKWYANTRAVFWRLSKLDREKSELWQKLQQAKSEMAAALQRESAENGICTTQQSQGNLEPIGMLPGGRPLYKPSPALEKIRQKLEATKKEASEPFYFPGTTDFGNSPTEYAPSPFIASSTGNIASPWPFVKKADTLNKKGVKKGNL
ncbi:uncharacterized protein CTRU02_210783 [Colletotrichum truncatum]|uniref:Uncharacterized protein n=1 Tax=Colletotrichum truncatum TaxID=5467 RepID=A0ACC3YPZ6_COLTU|nr:uncharacterized protein CTRU02_03730 [Colletotrichum truncatum]KAF6796752.1 hypothetical protein CTRU02_03730 [Colletotrichum truncatum]